MVSTIRPWLARFADSLVKGDVIATDRMGNEQMEIIAKPRHHVNLVGARTYVILTVRLPGTYEEGEMIYPSSAVTFVQNK